MATQRRQHALLPYLLFRCDGRLCALPLAGVLETMRPQPIDAVAGAPPFVLGLAIVRGAAVPVVHLARLLGVAPAIEPRRLILLEVGEGRTRVAVAVDEVLGVRRLDLGTTAGPDSDLPALLRDADAAAVSRLKRLDGELLWLLLATRILPPAALEGATSPAGPAASEAPA